MCRRVNICHKTGRIHTREQQICKWMHPPERAEHGHCCTIPVPAKKPKKIVIVSLETVEVMKYYIFYPMWHARTGVSPSGSPN